MNPIGSDTSGTRPFHFQSQFMHKIEMAHLLESRAIWMRSRLPPCSPRFNEMRHVRLIYFWTSQMERSRPGGIGTYRVHRQALLWSLSGSIGARPIWSRLARSALSGAAEAVRQLRPWATSEAPRKASDRCVHLLNEIFSHLKRHSAFV